MADVGALVADLAAESAALDELVADLSADAWQAATPSPGWTIAHQIAHLGWTDEVALLAATDPRGASPRPSSARPTGPRPLSTMPPPTAAARPPGELLARWRDGRSRLAAVLAEFPAGTKLPWFGPPMSAASMATARLMETWAHGQDVADALGVVAPPTDRLRHVAHIGVRARDYRLRVNGLDAARRAVPRRARPPRRATRGRGVPTTPPSGSAGPALDFCLLVTQRRHRDDLAVTAEGADADRWLTIAQAFAGPPGAGRAAGASST